MKLIEEQSLDRGIELFDGRLKGIPITAALGLEHFGKQFVVFFAGRHLCKQEISETNWTNVCNIEDIADWIDCSEHEDVGPSRLWIIVIVVVVIIIVVTVIVIVIVIIYIYIGKLKSKSVSRLNMDSGSTLVRTINSDGHSVTNRS